MRGSQRLLWSGVALLALLAACGGGNNSSAQENGAQPPAQPASSIQQQAPAGTPATPASTVTAALPGDPPTSPATARIDGFVLDARLPPEVSVFGRTDLTNERAAEGQPDLLKRFADSGRETGVQYILTISGAQRISLGINQYATPEGARSEFERGRPRPGPADRIDIPGLGDDYAAARVTLGSGETRALVNNIVFIRGRYFVTMADFANAPGATADAAIAVARALDDVLKRNPNP